MNAYFRRQLTLYSTFHGNAGNCLLHGVGIPPIFFAVMVVLALRLVPIAGAGISIGTLLLIPDVALAGSGCGGRRRITGCLRPARRSGGMGRANRQHHADAVACCNGLRGWLAMSPRRALRLRGPQTRL